MSTELLNIYFNPENRKGIHRSLMNAAKKSKDENIITFCAMKKKHFSDLNNLKIFLNFIYEHNFLPSEVVFEICDDDKERFNVKFTAKL